MKRSVWLMVILLAAAGSAALAPQGQIGQSILLVLAWFLVGLLLTPVWWFAMRSRRTAPWAWHQWLNTGAGLAIWAFVVWALAVASVAAPLFRMGSAV